MKSKLLLISTFALCTIAKAQISTIGLVGNYQFSGNANDASINANNGTVYGATLTADRFGNANSAYSFNGINNYIQVSNSSSLQFASNLQTVSFWMKIPSIPNPVDEQAIFEKMDQHLGTDLTGNSAQGFQIQFAPSADIRYRIKSGSGSSWGVLIIPNNFLSANQYYNIVFTNDNDSLRSYLNGVKINAVKIPLGTVIGANTSPLLIGKELWTSNGAPMDYFNGILDDIAIYDRALSPCEVNQLYNSQNFKITTSPNTICSGQPFTINAIGASNYAWNTGASTSSITVTPSISTVYSVTTTYSAGCSETRTLNITVNSSPTVSVTSGAICANQSFTMVSSGASTYTYSSGSAIVSPTTNATYYYSVTGTDANGCVFTNTAVSSVTVNALPTVSVTSGAICAGKSFTMVSSGASTYTYSSGSAIVSPTTNATYSVTGTSAKWLCKYKHSSFISNS